MMNRTREKQQGDDDEIKLLKKEELEVAHAKEVVAARNKAATASGYNPRVGIPHVLIQQLFFTLSRTCAKYISEAHPDMTTYELCFILSASAFTFNVILINRDLKMVMWDSVQKENRFNLFLKVVQGLI